MKTHHTTALTYLALMIGTLALAFASCKKSPETIGNNLISDNNYIGVYHTDTTKIVCHSYFDSIATSHATSALLGATKDPVLVKRKLDSIPSFVRRWPVKVLATIR